jgi:hypothetical protein
MFSQMNPIHTFHLISLRSISTLSSRLSFMLITYEWIFLSDFLTKIYFAFLISRTRIICRVHLIPMLLTVQSAPAPRHFIPVQSNIVPRTLFSSPQSALSERFQELQVKNSKRQVSWMGYFKIRQRTHHLLRHRNVKKCSRFITAYINRQN